MPEAATLNDYYSGSALAFKATAEEDALLALMLDIARRVFAGEDVEADPALYAAIDAQLQAGIAIGLGEDFPDAEFRTRLATNVSQFSAGKSVWEVVSINRLLPDPATGQPRSWVDFREEVLKLHGTANVVWMRTEYNTAVGRAQGAASWQRAWADREAVPYLAYRTVGDDRVRPTHRAMNGITLEITHPWWNTHYPPNDWECRCLAEQLAEAPENGLTDPDRLGTVPLPPPLFRDNPGVTGNIFNPAHPYFNFLPKAVQEGLLQ